MHSYRFAVFVPHILISWFLQQLGAYHDDVIKWKPFPRYWPFLRGIHRWIPRTKGQWRGDLMFSLICAWTDSWANNGDAGDLRRYRAHNDAIVILTQAWALCYTCTSITSTIFCFEVWYSCHKMQSLWYFTRGFYQNGLTTIPIRLSNRMPSKVSDYLFIPNFHRCAVEVWEWTNSFMTHFIMALIIYPLWE